MAIETTSMALTILQNVQNQVPTTMCMHLMLKSMSLQALKKKNSRTSRSALFFKGLTISYKASAKDITSQTSSTVISWLYHLVYGLLSHSNNLRSKYNRMCKKKKKNTLISICFCSHECSSYLNFQQYAISSGNNNRYTASNNSLATYTTSDTLRISQLLQYDLRNVDIDLFIASSRNYITIQYGSARIIMTCL